MDEVSALSHEPYYSSNDMCWGYEILLGLRIRSSKHTNRLADKDSNGSLLNSATITEDDLVIMLDRYITFKDFMYMRARTLCEPQFYVANRSKVDII